MKNLSWNEIHRDCPGKSVLLLWALVAFFLLTGCGAEKLPQELPPETESHGPRLYYLNEERTKLVSESYQMKEDALNTKIANMLTDLEAKLWTEEELEVLEERNPIVGFEVKADELLSLQFAADYSMVHTTTSVLRRAAIVKTLCQLEGVSAVEIYIGAQPLLHSNGKPVGIMKAENFVDSTGENTEFYQEEKITVYFSDETGEKLVESNLKVIYDGTVTTERLVVEQLLEGPVTEGMVATLPEGTLLNRISVKDGVCYVDFNENFLEKREGISAQVTIYSVVNSLAELSGVYKVQFLINGEIRKTYHNMDFSGSFERNLDIVEGEQ